MRRPLAARALRWMAALTWLAAAALAQAEGRLQDWTGAPAAPPLELRSLDGQTVALAALRGRLVVVSFWATWCPPCVEELPSLARLQKELGGAGLTVLAVNYMEGPPRIHGFLEKHPVDLTILRDADGGVARAWKTRFFPSTYVVDPEGRIRLVARGELDWAAPVVIERLRPLLPKP